MASATISEERASSDLENSFTKEKLGDVEVNPSSSEIKSDAVLDEIAAKVGALDFSDENEGDLENPEAHSKYMETIKKQGETINTLVRQLRIMFDEYQEVNQEREYYEDLNDALIRCLELSEGRVTLESGEETEEENVANLVNKEQETIISETKEETVNEKEDTEETTENQQDQSTDETTQTEDRKMSNADLLRLNQVLLREIYELRYQLQSIKERIEQEFYETEDDESEYDTATDDENHVCEHCCTEQQNENTQEESQTEIGEKNESYEHLEESMKIKDETDTE